MFFLIWLWGNPALTPHFNVFSINARTDVLNFRTSLSYRKPWWKKHVHFGVKKWKPPLVPCTTPAPLFFLREYVAGGATSEPTPHSVRDATVWMLGPLELLRSSIHGFNYWLVVEPTQLKNISQIESFPQVGVNIKDTWNHHLEYDWWPLLLFYWMIECSSEKKRSQNGGHSYLVFGWLFGPLKNLKPDLERLRN